MPLDHVVGIEGLGVKQHSKTHSFQIFVIFGDFKKSSIIPKIWKKNAIGPRGGNFRDEVYLYLQTDSLVLPLDHVGGISGMG